MSDEAKAIKHDGSGSGGAVVVLMLLAFFGLPVLYVLSLGPAIWLIETTGADAEFFEVLYAPLEWLHSNVEFVRPLLDWYVELWR